MAEAALEAALDEGALRLDFEDWFAKLPKRIRDGHSVKEIRQWFDSADDNGDGVLSVDEFFSFTLSNAAIKHGATSLANALRAFDTSSDKTGDLDLLAWEMMCDDMGFAKHAHDIFTSLDSDMSGTVSGDELATTLRSFDVSDVSLDTKKLVITLAWSWDERSQADARKALEAQAMSWRITGRDAETVRAQLQENLARSGAMVADLVKLFDDDNDTDLCVAACLLTSISRLPLPLPSTILTDDSTLFCLACSQSCGSFCSRATSDIHVCSVVPMRATQAD